MTLSIHASADVHGARPVARGLASGWGLLVAVALLFFVSGGLLWEAGYNYDGLSGAAATKVHPFTYAILSVAGWRAFARGNPFGFAARVCDRTPAAVFMIFAALVVLATAAARGGAGLAGIIDTFVGPAVLAALVAQSDERSMRRLETLLHVAMAANALLGLFEFASKTLTFPYRFDGATFESDARSTAFQGHPLANAAITCVYILALIGGAHRIPRGVKACLVALQCAALVIFGGRTAIVVTLGVACAHLVLRAARALRAGRVSLVSAAAALALAPILAIAVTAVVASGSLDAILLRFSFDGGSANARAEMFDLFQYFSLMDLIVGPDQAYLESLRRINGLEWGIENPFVRMILYNGAFFTLLLAVAVIAFLREGVRGRESGIWLPMLALTIILNASESIASKTTILAKLVVVFVCLYHEVRKPAAPVNAVRTLTPRRR